jgi:hypothetical protein
MSYLDFRWALSKATARDVYLMYLIITKWMLSAGGKIDQPVAGQHIYRFFKREAA